MQNALLRLAINAAALWVAAWLLPGIGFGAQGQAALSTVLVVALIFGVANALIRPILALITCPIHLLTLGLFAFVLNAIMLQLTARVAQALDQPFYVEGFGAALLGSLVISLVSTVLGRVLGANEEDD